MKKIMIHINSLGKGGAERVVSLLAGCFQQDKIQVVIATLWQEKEEYPLAEGVKRIHVGLTKEEESASSLKQQWIRLKNLRRALRKEKPDILLSFCAKANYRALMAAWETGCPVVASVRNDPKIDYVGRKKQLLNKLFLNKAAGCVFQTEEARDFFDQKLQKKGIIICNPVNERFLQAERKPAEKKIVCVGRLVKQKNQMLLVKAFEGILQAYPDYHLYLYGDGSNDECKEELQQYVKQGRVKEIPLTERIHFMGLSSSLEKDMANAAMFVLPSNYEGMPNALMEAMALGIPVISTDCPCGGSRYWITPGKTGQLVAVGDVKGLQRAMEEYIQYPKQAEAMGREAGKRLQEAALPRVYEQWKNYLNRVMIGRN